MNEQLRQKLAKVYELVNRGGTEGERAAAKKALDRIIAKYNLKDIDFTDLNKKEYRFKYSTRIEMQLFVRIVKALINADPSEAKRDVWGVKEIVMTLSYMDFITLEAAYEYFRRHMKKEWQRLCAPIVAKCRKAKTRNKKRSQLQYAFFQQYCIKSKLYKQEELRPINMSELSAKEVEDLYLLSDIEGGQYNRQMTNGLLIGE